ncbi:hypothetical protein J31TS6_08090 [Brevibacillus reuszeri]|nr:hypothetical protein J31TS6_08090 [Brevibacillus reuszeri]
MANTKKFDKRNVSGFENLLKALHEVKDGDPAEYESYKGAVSGLLEKMNQSLNPEANQ